MPPQPHLTTPLRAWRCPQCNRRAAFSTSRPSRAVGPEHPQYLPVPEPPQQTVPYHPPVKGSLPVPRNVLAGASGKDKTSDWWLDQVTQRPQRPVRHTPGSREEWKVKMADSRRRNLREGLKTLRARQQHETRKRQDRAKERSEKHEAALNAPEREDERINAITHGLDLDALFNHAPQDPHRDERLAHKRANVAQQAALKSSERLNHLHTLYMNARNFIVTPQQLDAAVEEAFGTPDKPVSYAKDGTVFDNAQSVWVQGKPASVQDMLAAANGGGRGAVLTRGSIEVSRERMRRIAEELTGGGMEEEA